MVKCEICGRSIRTGRKYCYEHRNVSPNIRIVVVAEKEFIKRHRWNLVIILFFIWIFSILSISLIGETVMFIASALLVLSPFYWKIVDPIAKFRIGRRTKGYEKFMKNYVKHKVDEREYKKSLFR